MNAKWWVLIALMSVIIVFTVQNYASVTLKLLFWSVTTSQAILVYITLLLGIIIGVLLSKKH